jgi:hypothetical protein
LAAQHPVADRAVRMIDDTPAVRHATPDAAFANRRDVVTAQLPSMGTMSARAMARRYAALLGHIPGMRLLSSEQLRAVAAVAYTGRDHVMELDDVSWSLGYSPSRPEQRGVASR